MSNLTNLCKGCLAMFAVAELSEGGYCESCQYQYEANLDNLTDED